MKKVIIIFGITILCLVGCNKKESIEDILNKNNYVIVDVRTKQEYLESHVKDSINIPYNEINNNTNLDKDKTILVYCKSGVRSSKAYLTLKNLGYNVIDLGAYDKVTLEKE